MNFKNWNDTLELQSDLLGQTHGKNHLLFSHTVNCCLLCLQNCLLNRVPAKQRQCLCHLGLLVSLNDVLFLLSPVPESWFYSQSADSELRNSTMASGWDHIFFATKKKCTIWVHSPFFLVFQMSGLTFKLQLFSSQLNNLNIVPGLCLWGFHVVHSWNGVKCILPTHSSVLHANMNSSICWRQWLLKSNKLCLFKLGYSIHSTRAGDSSEVIFKDEHLSYSKPEWMYLLFMSEMVTTFTHRYCPCCGLDTWLPQALLVPVCTVGFPRHGSGFLLLVHMTTWKSCCVNQRQCLSIGHLKWAEPLLFHCMLDLSCRCYWDVSVHPGHNGGIPTHIPLAVWVYFKGGNLWLLIGNLKA